MVREISVLLDRAGRPDLAAQIHDLTFGAEEISREDRRRSFYTGAGRRDYFLEFDTRSALIVLDVARAEGIIAVHVLAPED
jgi:hypothetical protein